MYLCSLIIFVSDFYQYSKSAVCSKDRPNL